ncbi:MAG: insulinase family protein [Holosporaceae bacterium]|jgi:predicted Zn-dependent peptidase|nr:insulinase family protein [Holosporaceae bacterium]
MIKKFTALPIILIALIAAIAFFKEKKPTAKISLVSNSRCDRAYQIRVKSDVIYAKFKFKSAGVLRDVPEKRGIAVIVADLLSRRINGLSPAETKEKLAELGVNDFSINASGDDFIVSFCALKDNAAKAFEFLSSIFDDPKFSKNDLEFVKEKYPRILDADESHPQELLFEKLMSVLYRDHNYGLSDSGTSQSVSSVTEEDVRNFIKLNLTKNNLEVFFTGDMSQAKIESYIKTLFSKLPRAFENKNDDISSSPLSEEKEDTIHKKNMENVVGIMQGVRIDKLNKIERAATRIIIETLFDRKTGLFCEGLRSQNIAYEVDYHFLQRKLSNVLYFTVYLDKKDLKKYKDYLKNCFELKLSDLNEILREKKRLIASSKNGFAGVANLDEKTKLDSLPFGEITLEILANVAKKIFDESKTRTVYIMQ